MTSALAYDDRLLWIAALDAEWTRYQPENAQDPLEAAACRFTAGCRRHHTENRSAAAHWAAARGAAPETADPRLLNPMIFLPGGHPDILSLTFLDDFDALHSLCGRVQGIEEQLIGYGILADTLGPEAPWLVNVADLWAPEADRVAEPGEDGRYATQATQLTAPALTVSPLKLDGLFAVGDAGVFEEGIVRAAVRRMADCIQKLAGGGGGPDAVRSLRVALVHFLGQEQIGIICMSADFSLNMTVVGAVRGLRWAEVAQSSREAAASMKRLQSRIKSPPPDTFTHLDAMPVLTWSRTLAGRALDAPAGTLEGRLAVRFDLRLDPGPYEARWKMPSPPCAAVPEDGTLCWIGRVDQSAPRESSPLYPAEDVFTVLRDYIRHYAAGGPEPGIIADVTTQIGAPVPRALLDSYGQSTGLKPAPLAVMLDHIRRTLYAPAAETPRHRLSPRALEHALRPGMIPVALARSIRNLFHLYLSAVVNPHHFELVIDLHDAFLAFFAVLTEGLPAAYAPPGRDLRQAEGYPHWIISHLAVFTEHLQENLEQRLHYAQPYASPRGNPVDFRRLVHHLLAAAYAPLKCGIGIVRRHAGDGGEQPMHRVGAFVRLGLQPGMSVCTFRLGEEVDETASLNILEADVSHLLHPATLCDYLHEAFHLLYDVRDAREARAAGLDADNQDRLAEIHADLLTLRFLFPDRPDVFLAHNIRNFSHGTRCLGSSQIQIAREFAERFTSLYIATRLAVPGGDPLRGPDDDFESMLAIAGEHFREFADLRYRRPHLHALFLEVCRARFRDIIQDLGPRLPALREKVDRIWEKVKKDHPGYENDYYEIRRLAAGALDTGTPVWRVPHAGQLDGSNPLAYTCAFLCALVTASLELPGNGELRHLGRCPDTGTPVFPPPGPWAEFLSERGSAAAFAPLSASRRRRLRRQIVLGRCLAQVTAQLRLKRLENLLHPADPPTGLFPRHLRLRAETAAAVARGKRLHKLYFNGVSGGVHGSVNSMV